MTQALHLELAELAADLETRTGRGYVGRTHATAADFWAAELATVRASRDRHVRLGRHASAPSQTAARQATRIREWLGVDDAAERTAELQQIARDHAGAMSSDAAAAIMQALQDEAAAATDAQYGLTHAAPVAPAEGYADVAALEARIAEIRALLSA